jgi:hypothetical protein
MLYLSIHLLSISVSWYSSLNWLNCLVYSIEWKTGSVKQQKKRVWRVISTIYGVGRWVFMGHPFPPPPPLSGDGSSSWLLSLSLLYSSVATRLSIRWEPVCVSKFCSWNFLCTVQPCRTLDHVIANSKARIHDSPNNVNILQCFLVLNGVTGLLQYMYAHEKLRHQEKKTLIFKML